MKQQSTLPVLRRQRLPPPLNRDQLIANAEALIEIHGKAYQKHPDIAKVIREWDLEHLRKMRAS